MLRLLLAAAVLMTAGPAAADPPSAQAAYAERRALLEADRTCSLFTPAVRSALEAGARQARGVLLRGGWTSARLGELEQAAVSAARGRACGDERTERAAERARASFTSWTRLPEMRFPGGERAWIARRAPDAAGWSIVQHFTAPATGAFGVRQGALGFELTLPAGARAPASAELILRDVNRAQTLLFDVPGRVVRGLEAGAPSPASAIRIRARTRSVNGRRILFSFPAAATQTLAQLDPRESVVVMVDSTRHLIEVGDFAAARAFLAAR